MGVFQNTYRKTELESCHFRHADHTVHTRLELVFERAVDQHVAQKKCELATLLPNSVERLARDLAVFEAHVRT